MLAAMRLAAFPGAGEVVEVTGVLDGGLGQRGVAPLVGDANKRAVVGLIEAAVSSLHEGSKWPPGRSAIRAKAVIANHGRNARP
jgi:hypothetical protein